MFIGRSDAEAETPILGHLLKRIDSFEKTLMLGKSEGGRRRQQKMRREEETTEDGMFGWLLQLNGHEFE